jgi:hypothetical protein
MQHIYSNELSLHFNIGPEHKDALLSSQQE